MILLGYLCILNCWITGAHPLTVLVQTPSEILAAKGEEIRLSCNVKGTNLNDVYWYKIDRSSTAHFVKSASVMNSQVQGTGITERFQLDRKNFQQSFSLTIRDLRLADNGTYYCLMSQSQKMSWGAGSVVTVVPERQKVTSPPPPPTTRRRINRYKYPDISRKKKGGGNGYMCNWAIWGSLVACNLLLLISIVAIVIHRRKRSSRRRCPHQFQKR
uniref:CD8b n=1 Tax=Scyliorhinus canicula TaxID=7830 RepID=A0A8K1YI10_SCYCA|nr:CD8b [Scyliorhinus canicula]